MANKDFLRGTISHEAKHLLTLDGPWNVLDRLKKIEVNPIKRHQQQEIDADCHAYTLSKDACRGLIKQWASMAKLESAGIISNISSGVPSFFFSITKRLNLRSKILEYPIRRMPNSNLQNI